MNAAPADPTSPIPPGCRVLRPDEDGLSEAAALLRSGACVAVPTETVYGLAGNALDERAVRLIFQIKGRPLLDPLIVHLPESSHVGRYAEFDASTSRAVERLAERFWPGPMTLVLRKKPVVPDVVTADLPTVALRVPSHPTMRALLARLDFPLAAPSANPFGYVSPTTAQHVLDSLGDRIPAVLDAGPCEHGLESTVLDLRDPNKPVVLRPGPIGADDVAHALGVGVTHRRTVVPATAAQLAPGLLGRHYSPRTPIVLVEAGDTALDEKQEPAPGEALLLYRRPSYVTSRRVYWLSESGDEREAAGRLFEMLRTLDAAGFALLRVQRAPERGLGIAINDRLRRASHRTGPPV